MIKKTLFAIIAVAALAACNQQDVLENLTEVQMPITPVVETTTSVTPDLAKIVALSARDATASRNVKAEECVSNITAVRSSHSGDPLFYAVNFSDSKGFVLVSGSQNYTPILAEVESGTFDEATIPDNMRYYLEEYKFAIEASNEAPDDSVKVYRQQWERYFRKNEPIINNFSRTISPSQQAFIYDSQMKWGNLGYRWTSLAQNTMGLDFFEDIMWEVLDSHPDIDLGTCFIVWKSIDQHTIINDLVSAKWDQCAPYNAAVKSGCPAGCVPVAMGQLMRYHKKPTTFNWNAMADRYYTWETAPDVANLLSDIGTKAKTTYNTGGSGTTIDNAVKALKTYGYSNVKSVSHNQITVRDNIGRKRPVIGTGIDPSSSIGHSWLYTGYDDQFIYYRYYLYILTGNSATDYRWEETELSQNYIKPGESVEYSSYTVYINWGYGGNYDGWFRDDNIRFNINSTQYCDYSKDKKDIVDIY